MSRIALGRTFAKFNVASIDSNYKDKIIIPTDSIISISTYSTIKGSSIIYFKTAIASEIEHVVVEDSVDDIDNYLRSIGTIIE